MAQRHTSGVCAHRPTSSVVRSTHGSQGGAAIAAPWISASIVAIWRTHSRGCAGVRWIRPGARVMTMAGSPPVPVPSVTASARGAGMAVDSRASRTAASALTADVAHAIHASLPGIHRRSTTERRPTPRLSDTVSR